MVKNILLYQTKDILEALGKKGKVNNMSYYQKKKEELRQEAIRFMQDNLCLSWWDIYDYQEYLETQARKYGLLKEFKENGVI